jgi:2-isopropylmalate synthase
MNKIIVFDTTLRDGELTHGVRFSPSDTLAIASLLAESRVDVIEVAIAGASEDVMEEVRAIAREVRTRTLCVLAPLSERAIDAAGAALKGAAGARIRLFQAGPASDPCASLTESLVRRAKGLTGEVEFSPANGACAPLDGVAALVRAALRGGATTINLADTVGCALPKDITRRMLELVARVPEAAGACVSFHGHNDLGLATANTLAAVRAGARQIEVAVNGLGARAGNAALEEVVAALSERGSTLRGRTGVDLDALVALSRLSKRGAASPCLRRKRSSGAMYTGAPRRARKRHRPSDVILTLYERRFSATLPREGTTRGR